MSQGRSRGRLGRRLFEATFAFSLSVTLLASGLRAASNYSKAERDLASALEKGIKTYAEPTEAALWVFDKAVLQSQVESMANLDFISWAAVTVDGKVFAEAGTRPAGKARERDTTLIHSERGHSIKLGELRLVADEAAVGRIFADSLRRDLPLLVLMVLAISSFLLVYVDRRISRRVVSAAEHFVGFDPRERRPGLPVAHSKRRDEVDDLVLEYNRLEERFRQAFAEVESARERAEASEAALESSLREKDVLIGELFHRTRNNLQVTLGLIQLEKSETDDSAVTEALSELEVRIQAMAIVHRSLQERVDLARIRLDDFVKEFAPFACRARAPQLGPPKLEFALEPIEASIDVATPFGLALGELLGSLVTEAPIRIALRERKGEIHLELEGSTPGGATSSGEELARSLIEGQLRGSFSVSPGEGGLKLVRASFLNRA